MIKNSADAFFHEMGEHLLLLGEEVRPSSLVDDRIDLLAVDPHGVVVVIELKRGRDKLQLLQALGYAATVAKWERHRLIDLRSQLVGRPGEEVEEELEEFLVDAAGSFNSSQRVILIAEDFDYMVLATAEWLSEKFEMDVRCYRVRLSADGEQEYLACTCIYPAPELSQHANSRARKTGSKPPKWPDWDTALRSLINQNLVDFYRAELASGTPHYLRRRILFYSSHGKRRLWVTARRKLAYAWQMKRFDGDVEFWRSRLSDPDSVRPVKDDRALRFFLVTASDFEKFKTAVYGPFQSVQFLSDDELEADDDQDADSPVD